jgi:membrane-associated phospholipid phosphatase
MNGFDSAIQTYITQHAFSSPLANQVIAELTGFYLAKGVLMMAALWWIWFQPSAETEQRRETVVATLASGLIALFVGRLLARLLPFRLRPYFDPVNIQSDATLRTWSSFPSDHAMLWTAVAMGIFLVWRNMGILALLFSAVLVCAPRVYVGLHYPTDVMVGAVLGIVITFLVCTTRARTFIARPVLHLFERYPGLCYSFAFVFSFELATQFDEIRIMASLFIHRHAVL